MSTRKISREQFSDRSTIDGDRIQKAVTEVIDRTNDVPLDDISRSRSVQTMVLKSHMITNVGAAAGGIAGFPWLYASSDNTSPTWRAKGIEPGRTSAAQYNPSVDYAGIWTSSTVFDRPIILDSIAVHIDMYSDWYNIVMFKYSSQRSLLQVLIDTDNQTTPEDRRYNSKEFHLHDYDSSYALVPLMSPKVAATDDMLPALPSSMTGASSANVWVLERNDLNIPIHQLSRVRFRLAFAEEDNISADAEWNASTPFTKMPGHPTFVVTYKETIHG
tara:strand:- start:1321 stop:2142 length:822 start_codon:yes stop_codon:yes gene_type:complete